MSDGNYNSAGTIINNQKGEVGVEYRTIPSLPGYFVGSDGSFWSSRNKVPRKLHPNQNKLGYWRIRIRERLKRDRSVFIHRMILEAFVGQSPPNCLSRHLDGNPANVSLDNLAWGTQAENYADSIKHGTNCHGERHGCSRLTNAQAISICERARGGEHVASLAKEFGVSISVISKIKLGLTWTSVCPPLTGPPPFYRGAGQSRLAGAGERNANSKLTAEEVRAMRVRRQNGETLVALATDYGVTHKTVHAVCNRRTWKHIL